MSVESAQLVATVIEAWLGVGLLVAVAFACVGTARVDPDARGATLGFKLLVIPGAMLLWPLVLKRWLTAKLPPTEINSHRRAAADGGSKP